MHFDDLTQYSRNLKHPINAALNVGWLDGAHSFAKGPVGEAFIKKLCDICASTDTTDVHVNIRRSVQQCPICGKEHFEVPGCADELFIGMSQIWIPRPGGGFFAAPSLILHFIVEHGYCPPQEFQEAVQVFDLSTPFSGQEAYLESVAGAF